MDRIINIKVGGNHLSKDSKNAGVRGEANVTKLRITFDEGWDGYAKTVTFWDAQGKNPVKRIQGVDLIEDITTDKRTYITPIPKEPLAIAGELTFVIDGYLDGKRQRSISDKLVVKDSPDTDNAGEPTDPTPTQAEQLQSQIEKIKNTIQNAVIAEKNAKTSEENTKNSEGNAKTSEENAKESAEKAEGQSKDAILAADKAENAISHNPVIIDGYWHIWSIKHEEYINTNVKAQAGSEVYIGDNPPASADIIIDLDGESAMYAPYIGENGNWYTFNPEMQTFTDSGFGAKGDKGDKGDTGAKGEDGHTPTPEELSELLNTPREVIHLTNDMRIESREDGIWLVDDSDPDQDKMLYSKEYTEIWANYAGYAECAGLDSEGRDLKGCYIEDCGDVSDVDEVLYDGDIKAFGIVSDSLVVSLPREYQYIGFTLGLYFTTPSEMPNNYSTFPKDIHFKGDSVDEGTFVPEPDTRYTIVFDFDGYMLNGYVSGVSAPPISEVTENE